MTCIPLEEGSDDVRTTRVQAALHRHGRQAADPEWMILREFYCPGCTAQLDVEAVPPGYPFIFKALPDIDGFYEKHPELRWRLLGTE